MGFGVVGVRAGDGVGVSTGVSTEFVMRWPALWGELNYVHAGMNKPSL